MPSAETCATERSEVGRKTYALELSRDGRRKFLDGQRAACDARAVGCFKRTHDVAGGGLNQSARARHGPAHNSHRVGIADSVGKVVGAHCPGGIGHFEGDVDAECVAHLPLLLHHPVRGLYDQIFYKYCRHIVWIGNIGLHSAAALAG